MKTFNYDPTLWDEAKEQAYAYLSANAHRIIYYSQLVAHVTAIKFNADDPPFHGLLGQISEESDAMGRGMLSALVVRKGEMTPGKGFFNLARSLGRTVVNEDEFWISEINRIRSCKALCGHNRQISSGSRENDQ